MNARRLLAGLLATAALGTVAGLSAVGPAAAATPAAQGSTTSLSSAQLKANVADLLKRSPGARQIAPNQVEVQPGVVETLGLNLPGRLTPKSLEAYCRTGSLCLFNNSNFNVGTGNGTQLSFDPCGDYNLGHIAFPGGGYWNDKTSSVINNQYGTSATAELYNYSGHGNVWDHLASLETDHHLANLQIDGFNDTIDGVHNCGSLRNPWTPN